MAAFCSGHRCSNKVGWSPDVLVDVHGGITFAGKLKNEPLDLWWFGWDAAHMGDYIPGYGDLHSHGIYRGKLYAIEQTELLAEGLRRFQNAHA